MCESDDLPEGEHYVTEMKQVESTAVHLNFDPRQMECSPMAVMNSFYCKSPGYVRVWVLFNFRDKVVSGL